MTIRPGQILAVVLSACGTARSPEPNLLSCPTWKGEVSAALASRCVSCHGSEAPAGGVDLTSYASTIGDPSRQSLAGVLDPATASEVHRRFSFLQPMLARWTGECQLAYLRSSIHPGGILDPTSTDFHGAEVARRGWLLEECTACHGADYKGGKAASACTTCHTGPGGPEACTTCHGQPPASGAHLAHATSPVLGRAVACAECHQVPATLATVGHVHTGAGAPDPAPAELTFGALAAATGDPSARLGPPAYAGGSCANIYCHGDTLGAAGATHPRPSWHGGPAEAECGSCHGAPPPGPHPQDPDCARCHTPAVHVNGVVELGDPAAGCNACHGSPTRPLSGPHRAHTEALHALSGPIACSECHQVPATIGAAGHLDPAPAEVTFGALAAAQGATPVFTAATHGCSGVACHGAAAVEWRPSLGAAGCGTCHGIPPQGEPHRSDLRLTDCATCHAATVDGHGNILVTGGTSAHINGRTDLAAP